jgi:hypothetical protein
MWDRYDSLVKAGMNMTDARRIANEDHLMLEPETRPHESRSDLDEYTPPLPKSVSTA